MKPQLDNYAREATTMLQKLITLQSFSGEEHLRASYLSHYLASRQIDSMRVENNLIVKQPHFDSSKPTLMLNSHIDTVKPAQGYTFNPFHPPHSTKYVYGLGSNDAGASVVSMLQVFMHFYEQELPFNLLLALSAEEEVSGAKGMRMLREKLSFVDFAIVGEPTGMRGAIAERGLLVVDGEAVGKSGHAARNEGVNALYIAIDDIKAMQSVRLDRVSPTMGEVKLTVTQINAGTQHNVVPDRCSFVVDIRPTDCYTNLEIMEILQSIVKSNLRARSLTNQSSSTPPNHLLMEGLKQLQIETFVSPTTSDWMHLHCPAIKMGPGKSERSHQSDEFVLIDELRGGIEGYINFIETLQTLSTKKEK